MRAANTERAYASDRADFDAWCVGRGASALPAAPPTLAAYLEACAPRLRASTVRRRACAVATLHRDHGFASPADHPAVRLAIARADWADHERDPRTLPLRPGQVRAMVRALAPTRAGARDRALLLIGYGAGLRRTELVALDVDDLHAHGRGLVVRAPSRSALIPPGSVDDLCAVRAWRGWCAAGDLADGPAFRAVHRSDRVGSARLSDRSVTSIVKRAAARAGLDPARVGGQSLRAGLLVTAAAVGAPERAIMAQSGHRSRRQVRRTIAR